MKPPTIFTVLIAIAISLTTPAFAKKKSKHILMGPTGILAIRDVQQGLIVVDGTEPGSPAADLLNKGDVIVDINGRGAPRNVREFDEKLAAAILEAESAEAGGILPITLKSGKTVNLKLQANGSFSATAPYHCAKTDAIITGAADGLINYLAKRKSQKAGTSHTQTELLGLMATGEKKYQEVAYRIIQEDFGDITYDGISLQARDRAKSVGAWATGYATIAMAEYYLLTKDETILPALKTYALSLAEGQDPAGLYGHKMIDPETNRAPGYGQMNNVSLACYMGMILAKKCGADVPGLDAAIERTEAYVKYHANAGGFAYGFHGPREWDWNNNGTSAMAALCMDLSGDKEAAKFFAATSAASFGSFGQGHASSLFSSYWTQAGAHLLGPEVTQGFFAKTAPYYTLRRNWDGSIQKCYNEGHMAGVVLLVHCLPRKALLITGREADESIWMSAKQARTTIDMGDIDLQGKTPEEILCHFGHPYPQVRSNAVAAIHGMVSGKYYEKMLRKNPAAAEASKQKAAALFPTFKQLVATGSHFEKHSALRCYLIGCPESELDARLGDLAAILKDPQQPADLRVVAATQLASTGKKSLPFFNDMLAFLMEDRPDDRFNEVDVQLSEAIDQVGREVEWNYYKAGFVTDKKLFHDAANRLMAHKRQNARGVGARMVRYVPDEKFHLVARPLEHILKNDDPAYHTYHNARTAMEPAVQIFGDHNILEGVNYLVDFILSGDGRWSFTMSMLTKSLPKYGIHAQPALPKIKEYKWVKVMYAQAAINNGEHRFLESFENMVQQIENATDGPPLIPLERAIELSKQADEKSAK